jgi:hypothetical protein
MAIEQATGGTTDTTGDAELDRAQRMTRGPHPYRRRLERSTQCEEVSSPVPSRRKKITEGLKDNRGGKMS